MPYNLNNQPFKVGRAFAASKYQALVPFVFQNTQAKQQMWEYSTGDDLSSVLADGYFTNGGQLGMLVGDVIFCTKLPEQNVSVVLVTDAGAVITTGNANLYIYDQQGFVSALTGPSGTSMPINNGVDTSQVPQLDPVDWYPDGLYASDGAFLYGRNSGFASQLRIYPVNGHTPTDGAATPDGSSITNVATTSTPGLIFIHAENSNGSGDIYRSVDFGKTMQLVLQFGIRNTWAPVSGTRSPNVRWLSNRSFCESVCNGKTVFFAGEYNIGTTRTIGGNNDAVCLWRSDDLGISWRIACEWNTDGNTSYNDLPNGGNYVRHIHAVKYSPIDGSTYVCLGDQGTVGGVANNVQAAFFQWNGVTPLPSNTLIQNFTGSGLRNLALSQRYRLVDLLFERDYLYVMTDAINAAGNVTYNSGVFKCDYQLTPDSYQRVDRSILQVNNRSGRIGLRTSGGYHLWLDAIEGNNTTTGEYFNSIYTSSRSLVKYGRNGVFRTKTGGVSFAPMALYEAGGNVYVVNTAQGLGSKDGTVVLRISNTKAWNGVRPDVLAPVYYVNSVTGVDSPSAGNDPSTPWKTLGYAATGSRVPYGGRIALAAGIYQENSIAPVFSTTLADITDSVYFSGDTMDNTAVGNQQSTNSWLFGPVAAVVQNWDFQDIRLTTFKSGTQTSIMLFTSYTYTSAFNIRFVRARIGRLIGDTPSTDGLAHIPINIANGSVALRPNITFYDSQMLYKNEADTTNSGVLFFHNNAAGGVVYTFQATRSIFWGGTIQHGGTASVMSFADCIHGGSTNSKGNINLLTSATTSPIARSGRFEANTITPQIVNDSTLPVVGAAQFVGCQVNWPLNAAAFFDTTSVYTPGGRIKDSYLNEYILID